MIEDANSPIEEKSAQRRSDAAYPPITGPISGFPNGTIPTR